MLDDSMWTAKNASRNIRTNWPSPQDFNECVQTPSISFSDFDLREAEPELTKLGLPKVASGNFASVYKLSSPRGEWAVRCFLHNLDEREVRYMEISRALAQHNLENTVQFEYLSKGLRANGSWLPILKMEWVAGEDLASYVSTNVKNSAKMSALCIRFKKMMQDLQTAGLAHGDLQHGNILVVGDELRLVDYDGMYVPGTKGLKATELGHRNFQHPARDSALFNEKMDNFSAWSIYVSLFCLSRDPGLWKTLKGGDECLLFKHSDYVTPARSSAFYTLESSKDREIVRHAKILRSLINEKPDDVPFLNDPVRNTPEAPKRHRSFDKSSGSRTNGQREATVIPDATEQFQKNIPALCFRYVRKCLIPNVFLTVLGYLFSIIGATALLLQSNPFGLVYLLGGIAAVSIGISRLWRITGVYARARATIRVGKLITSNLVIEKTGRKGVFAIEHRVRIVDDPNRDGAIPSYFRTKKKTCWLINPIGAGGDKLTAPVFFDSKGYPIAVLEAGKLRLFI